MTTKTHKKESVSSGDTTLLMLLTPIEKSPLEAARIYAMRLLGFAVNGVVALTIMIVTLSALYPINEAGETGPKFSEPLPMLNVVDDLDETVIVEHRNGITEIPRNPQRIFVTDGLLPIAIFLDLNVVAGYYPQEIEQLPNWEELSDGIQVRVADGGFDIEWILENQPDLILLDASISDWFMNYNALNAIAPTIVLKDSPSVYWQAATNSLTTVLDIDSNTLNKVSEIPEKLAEACKPLQHLIADETVITMFYDGDGRFQLLSPGFTVGDRYIPNVDLIPQTYCGLNSPDNLLELLNGQTSLTLHDNWLAELQADHIFICCTEELTPSDLTGHPMWQNVHGTIYFTPDIRGTSYDITLHAINLYTDIVTDKQSLGPSPQ